MFYVGNVLGCKLCLRQRLDPPATLLAKHFSVPKIYLIFAILQKYGNSWKYRNFWEKMKFKTRLVAGNSIWPAKIQPKGPLSPLELSCRSFWYHLKNSSKKIQKTIPPPKRAFFFWGGGGSGDSWHLCTMCLELVCVFNFFTVLSVQFLANFEYTWTES